MGLSALPSFSRRHRVPTGNRNAGGKPGAFAPQRREHPASPSPPRLVLALQEHSASCSMHLVSSVTPGSSPLGMSRCYTASASLPTRCANLLSLRLKWLDLPVQGSRLLL